MSEYLVPGSFVAHRKSVYRFYEDFYEDAMIRCIRRQSNLTLSHIANSLCENRIVVVAVTKRLLYRLL